MDIKELLGKTATELEALSDRELQEYFGPYLQYIQPVKKDEDSGQKKLNLNSPPRKSYTQNPQQNLDKAMEMAQRLAKQLGIKQ
jgi:hypothetical protein